MSSQPFKPSIDEINNFVAATLLISASFLALKNTYSLSSIVTYTAISATVLLLRELGQRTIAQWMDATIELNLSFQGSVVTALGAFLTFLTQLPLILLFPIFNSYDVESYEHWQKSIDAMWIQRSYWIVSVGILTLFIGWGVFYSLGMGRVAEAISIFTAYQLLPFNLSLIPTGPLDGSTIIYWNGFIWFIFMGTALLTALIV